MAKGDQVEIGIQMGSSDVARHVVTARQNGRSVSVETEKENNINWLVVREITRGGTVVEEVKAQLTDVVLIKTTRGE